MIKSPFTTKQERGAYSANISKDGDTFVAVDDVGTVIKEGTAAVVLQAAFNAEQDIFLGEETYDIGSTTLTLQNKSINIHGTGDTTIIKGSANPLIDVTLTSDYQLRMWQMAIHTTSTNKGINIDNCTSRVPLWLNNLHFVPEGHAGTLLYIHGSASAQISNCSFEETVAGHPSTTAKGIYLTANASDGYTQEFYLDACSFFYLDYDIQSYALPAHRAYLAGIHVAGSLFSQSNYPLNFECVDDIAIIGNTIECTTGTEKGIVLKDCLSSRIIGNRITTGSTTAQLELIGTNLDCYLTEVSGNYIMSYGRVGDGILLDCSPGNKYVGAIINTNSFNYCVDAVQATKGTTAVPVIIFNGNLVWDCTWNITGDIQESVVLGNVWGNGSSATVVNGTFGDSEIAHNHKT